MTDGLHARAVCGMIRTSIRYENARWQRGQRCQRANQVSTKEVLNG